VNCEVIVPADVVKKMNLKDGTFVLKDQLYGSSQSELKISSGVGKFKLSIQPGESFIYKL
jgi:hypothetical protein